MAGRRVNADIVHDERWLREAGGPRLRYRSWTPARPRAAVLVVPGLADHAGRYDRLADELTGLGAACHVLDLRGHGRSEGRRGHAPSFDALLDDVDEFQRDVATRSGDIPVILLGHSMGGLVVIRYLQRDRPALAGAVIASPWLETAVPVPRWKLALARTIGRLIPAVPVPAGIPADEISSDPAVVAAYRADPLVHGRITPRLFAEARAAMRAAFDERDRIETPVLVLIGEADRIVDPDRVKAFAGALEAEDGAEVTFRAYPGLRHELFNEPDRARPLADLVEWLEARLG